MRVYVVMMVAETFKQTDTPGPNNQRKIERVTAVLNSLFGRS